MAQKLPDDLASLCRLAFATGLYLARRADGRYTLGPGRLVTKHKALVEKLRSHKDEMIRLIESHMAFDVFVADDGEQKELRTVVCLHCHQPVVLFQDWLTGKDKLRLASHRAEEDEQLVLCKGSKEWEEDHVK